MSRQLTMRPASVFTTKTVNPSELLRAALRYLPDEERWAKKTFHEGNASCALGALEYASMRAGLAMSPIHFRLVMSVLLEVFRENHPEIQADSVSDFNDHDDMTLPGVQTAFEKAALRLEEQGY